MGLPLASLSPSPNLEEPYPFTAMCFTPRENSLDTNCCPPPILGCFHHSSTCLGFVFKHEVVQVAPTLYEDCFSWKISTHPFKDRKLLKLFGQLLSAFTATSAIPHWVHFIEQRLRRQIEKPFQECRHCTKGWLLGIHVAWGIRYSNQGGTLWGHWRVSSLVLPSSSLQKPGAAAGEIY